MNNQQNFFLMLVLSAIIIAARLIPHVPNFSPVAAIILFSVVYTKHNKYLLLPFVALLISDFFLGGYQLGIMLAVYGSLAIILLLGVYLKKHKTIVNTITITLGSGLIFFLLTNFAVWYFGSWYAADFNGLILSYTMAIPFFKQTIISNLLYVGLFFGAYESIQLLHKEKSITASK
ncbi:hypothetical protein HOD19_00910 [bacterium]|jgi:hypothetical protein|nr:hypothetical protein [bacterium]